MFYVVNFEDTLERILEVCVEQGFRRLEHKNVVEIRVMSGNDVLEMFEL